MRTARFFVPAEWVAVKAQAFSIPAGPLHKQILTVLRLKTGDCLSLMINDGTEYTGKITGISKSNLMGIITDTHTPRELNPQITVCAGITKRDTFEWMLQKCTELGATSFIPLLSDRVIKRAKDVPVRWQNIIKEASEQSGRVIMPTIHEPLNLKQALTKAGSNIKILLHEKNGQSSLPSFHKTSQYFLFIGPEGGFTEEEVSTAKDAGAHIITLGNLVMRAETAAIVGLSYLKFNLKD